MAIRPRPEYHYNDLSYDGDGALVKKVAGGKRTVCVSNLYEKNVTTGIATQYYLGAQRVAMQREGVIEYISLVPREGL